MLAKLLGPVLFMFAVLACLRKPEDLQKASTAIAGSGVILIAMALVAKAMGIDSDPNGAGGLGPPGMGPPVFAAHMLPVSMLALSGFLAKPRVPALIFALLCAAALVGAVQRTSAAALYAGFSVILFLGTRGIWRLLLPAAGVVALPAMIVFSDTFRRRMFFGNVGPQELLDDPMGALSKVNLSGRSNLWDSALNRFFLPHPIAGSGLGSTQDYFYTQAGRGVVHSEYVRLLCEVGLIGISLFAMAAVAYIWMMGRYVARSQTTQQRAFALAGAGSVVAYLIYCATDNAFDYVSQFGIYVFGLVAMAEKARLWTADSDREQVRVLDASAPPFPNLLR
jgi:O-antigen ligase